MWDIKYSKMGSRKCIIRYLPQLIVNAYAFNVEIGGIINVRNYGTSDPVYIHVESNTSVQDLMGILHKLIGGCKIENL